MSRSITCQNTDGYSITFSDSEFSPFILAHVDGIYEHQNNVNVVENTMVDGGTYQSSIATIRNIVISVIDKPENDFNQYHRDLLYVLFGKGKKGTLIYTENNVSRKIDYYPENIVRDNLGSKIITISLICPDPYFYDMNEVVEDIASWIPAFEFEHEFIEEGEHLGYRSREYSKNIVNYTAAENIGITIMMEAQAEVTNPTVTHVESQKHITLGNTSLPLVMQTGDIIMITTGTGDKHIYRIRNGNQREINGYMTEDSEFFQLMRGNNTIGYSADSGEENLILTIKYRYKYEGA